MLNMDDVYIFIMYLVMDFRFIVCFLKDLFVEVVD